MVGIISDLKHLATKEDLAILPTKSDFRWMVGIGLALIVALGLLNIFVK